MTTAHRKRRTRDATFSWAGDEAASKAVLDFYAAQGRIPLTMRHYFYALLGSIIHLNPRKPTAQKNAYNKVSTFMVKLRENGVLPWRAVIDTSRRSFMHYAWDSLAQYVAAKERVGMDVDIWRGQPRRLEVVVEKDAMADFVNNISEQFRIPVWVAKGYSSATVVKDAADRYGTGKGWTLLYCGDFDPSGLDIERSLRDTLAKHHCYPEIVRVALTPDDLKHFPDEKKLDLKLGDPRYAGFVAMCERAGIEPKGFELDVFPPALLRQKLLEAIGLHFDPDAFAEAQEVEQAVKENLESRLKGLFTGFTHEALTEGLPALDIPLETQRLYLGDPDDEDGDDSGDDDSGDGDSVAHHIINAAEYEAWERWDTLKQRADGIIDADAAAVLFADEMAAKRKWQAALHAAGWGVGTPEEAEAQAVIAHDHYMAAAAGSIDERHWLAIHIEIDTMPPADDE